MKNQIDSYQVDVSVVVPVFGSPGTLIELYERIASTFEEMKLRFEVLFVFDGGKEEAWKVLIELKKDYSDKIIAIRLSRNFGQHNATLCGISFASGMRIVTLDDDLQTPPEAIKQLIEKADECGADVVYGTYPNKKHGWFRNLGSRVFKKVIRYLVNGLDDGSSFRLLSRSVADDILSFKHHHVFIDQLLSWYTNDFAFINVQHESRRDGRSGYSTWKLFRLATNVFISYTDLPLKLMIWTGFFSSMLSIVLGVFFIVQRMLYGAQVGFTALIAAIFFTGGIILLSLGILGEYISRIYQSRLEKPAYSIKVIL